MAKIEIYQESRFRTPLEIEKKLGLWIDRIGSCAESKRPKRLRILGLYAFVYIHQGLGIAVSSSMGDVEVSRGDIITLTPEEPAMYFPIESWNTKHIVFNGAEAGFLENINVINKRKVIRDIDNTFLDYFGQIESCISDESVNSIINRKVLLLELINKLNMVSERDFCLSFESIIIDVLKYLKRHYSEPVRLNEVAAKFNLNETTFRKLFKEYTSTSPKKYLTSLRINAAKTMLLQGESIKTISRHVGYEDVLYFMRVFKNTTGLTCKEFLSKNTL